MQRVTVGAGIRILDTLDAIRGRRSVRSYKPDIVPDQLIEKVLEAARWAPVGGNQQLWRFIVVKDERILKLLKLLSSGMAFDPPVIIVVCMVRPQSPVDFAKHARDLGIEGISAAIQNMLLAAYSFSLGTCWIGAAAWKEVKSLLKIPEDIEPLSLVALGFPSEIPKPPPRLPLNEIACVDLYGNWWKK